MSQLNLIIVQGRVTKDCELKYSAKGNPYLKFTIANNFFKNVNGKKEKKASFFNVTAWDKIAEIFAPHLKKGSHIIVAGRIDVNIFTTENGEKKTYIGITANNIEFFTYDNEEENKKTA